MHDDRNAAGFAVLDNKGRLALPKVVRSALHVQGGSTVAYIVAGDTLLIVPQDSHLAALMERASSSIAAAGLTAQDYLDEVPGIRDELLQENYDAAFVARLRGEYARVRQDTTAPDTADMSPATDAG